MKGAIRGGLTCVVWLFLTATAYAHNYPDTILDFYASKGTFEVSASGDTWTISSSKELADFLTGIPRKDSFVKIPPGDYVILGFEDKTIIDGLGDDFTVHAASSIGAVDVYGFVNAFDEKRLIYLGEATETTAFDLASVGLDKGDRLVAVKIEGKDDFINRLSFQLNAIEISLNSVDSTTSELGNITGAVSDAVTKLPLSNVEVSLYDDTFTELIDVITTPDSGGYFEFPDRPAGQYNLRFVLEGYDMQEHSVLLEPGETSSLDIALDPEIVAATGTVSVTVEDSLTHVLLSDADVLFYSTESTDPIYPTHVDGEPFVFENIPEGSYTLSVSLNGYKSKTQTINLPSGASISIDVYLIKEVEENRLIISVNEVGREFPLEYADVTLFDSDGFVRTLQTGADGFASFDDLPLGWYDIRVSLDGYGDANQRVNLEAGDPLRVDVELESEVTTGSILVTVVDAETGNPLENVSVFIGDDLLSGLTATDGTLYKAELSPGFYMVSVVLDGYLPSNFEDVEVFSNEEAEVNFTLEVEVTTGSIRGTIFDGSGKPLSRAMVVLKQAEGSQQQRLTSDEGLFEFTDLDSGEVEIQATLSGYITQSKSLEIGVGDDFTVDFILQKEELQGTVMGTVMDGDTGEPVENALISIGDGKFSATTSRLGEYIIQDIPAGSLTLKVSKVGYRETTQTIELTSESTLRINVKLFQKGDVSINGRVIDSVGFKPVNGATIQIFNAGGFHEIRETSTDGQFSFLSLTPGKYVVEIEASGFKSRRRDVLIDWDIHQSVMIKLVPKAPEIISSGFSPAVIFSGVDEKVTFYVTVHDPDGVDDISGVFLSHPSLNTTLLGNEFVDGIEMERIASSVDRVDQTVRYEYQTSLLSRLPPREYLINVRAEDELGFQTEETFQFSVIQKNQFRLLKQQLNQTTLNNTLDKQTLVISVVLTGEDLLRENSKSQLEEERAQRSVDPADIECPECYVEVRIYRPDGTLYNEPYIVCDSKDITISNAEAGEWTYETTSYCPTSLDIEVETRGAGTAFLTGFVKDGDTGQAIPEARVQWSLGGETVSSETGYFSTIVLPGEGLVTTTSSNYKVNLKGNVVLTSTERKRLDITLLPEGSSLLPPPDQPIMSEISNPLPYPDPYLQPFAAGEIDSNFVISARFPAYQSDVSIYLGISSDAPELAPYFLLYNVKDELVIMEDVLVPWRDETSCCQWQQVDPLLSFPVEMLPPGKYTFYSLVTESPETLETYDLRYFTLDITSGHVDDK